MQLFIGTRCRRHLLATKSWRFCRRRQKVDGDILTPSTSTPLWACF